jgi:succinate dehydrogenase/fumarate reductase-like Fe-S protein
MRGDYVSVKLRPLVGPWSIHQIVGMNMEQRWHHTDGEEPKDSEKTNLTQCHFAHYISRIDCAGRELGPPRS